MKINLKDYYSQIDENLVEKKRVPAKFNFNGRKGKTRNIKKNHLEEEKYKMNENFQTSQEMFDSLWNTPEADCKSDAEEKADKMSEEELRNAIKTGCAPLIQYLKYGLNFTDREGDVAKMLIISFIKLLPPND